jgi:hypothetical protein
MKQIFNKLLKSPLGFSIIWFIISSFYTSMIEPLVIRVIDVILHKFPLNTEAMIRLILGSHRAALWIIPIVILFKSPEYLKGKARG